VTKVKAFWTWTKQNWKIPVIIVGIILGWLLFRSRREKGTPLAQTKVELQALEAAGQARAKEAELGAAQARAWVEVRYQVELKALDNKKAAQAKELRDDPAKLAAFLVRAGSGQ
jgi:hypothetical protein